MTYNRLICFSPFILLLLPVCVLFLFFVFAKKVYYAKFRFAKPNLTTTLFFNTSPILSWIHYIFLASGWMPTRLPEVYSNVLVFLQIEHIS